jgi:hypothetical protein
MRYALGREHSHHLSPTHVTLFVQPQGGNRYLMATILDRGPDAYEWIKVQLPNGDEAFCYPDTDLTVDIKSLQPGTQIAISTPRACNKPGTTRWTCNALHANLQPDAVNNTSSFKLTPAAVSVTGKERKSTPSITVRYSKARYAFIYEVMEREGFEGKYGKSDAVAFIVDKCMQAGIL